MLVSKFANEISFSKLSEVNRTQDCNLRKHYYKLRAPLDVLLLSFSGGDYLWRVDHSVSV